MAPGQGGESEAGAFRRVRETERAPGTPGGRLNCAAAAALPSWNNRTAGLVRLTLTPSALERPRANLQVSATGFTGFFRPFLVAR